MGGGGYVAGPVGAAALSRRIPLVLTEADSHLGLSNRVLARGARAVCLAFPIDDRDPPRYRVTGRPVPAVQTDRVTARQAFGIGTSEPCLIVFGGSQGARSLNVASLEAFASQSQLHVLHVCGRRDYPELAAMARSSSYQLLEYLDVERFGEALAAADLALARAGGSIFELAAHGLPALLVPYPHAAGAHQSANARWAAAAGAAIVIEDAALTPALLREQVDALIDDRERLAAMAAAARALARPHAADEIAAELLAAAGTR
jgi:UDP-N-acetylglucosamine--N-acetylmuramyl-(pentapeptide) pyrophosphoryl-undecaprenol N-acetylglucosamine transferase